MGIWFYTFLLKKIISLLCVHVNGIHQIYQDVNSCIILNHRIHKNIKPHTRWFHSIRQINVWSKLPYTWHCIEFDKIRCVWFVSLNKMMYPLQNVQSHKYQTREQFLHDVDLIHQNCEKYNGPGSNYTKTALKMSDLCRERLQEVRRLVISM